VRVTSSPAPSTNNAKWWRPAALGVHGTEGSAWHDAATATRPQALVTARASDRTDELTRVETMAWAESLARSAAHPHT
jgi:hypothetical protein